MNMMDVLTHKWDERLLEVVGGDAVELRSKLGNEEPVAGGTVLGTVGNWWVKRWGFSAGQSVFGFSFWPLSTYHPDGITDCLVSPFTGDNPATVAGLIAKPGSALLSLGTSTTFLLSLPPSSTPPKRTVTSHLLAHPSSASSSIIMLCYKNGALAREEIRNLNAERSWEKYNQLVSSSPAGSNGYMGLYFPLMEIIPPNVQGRYFFKHSFEGVAPTEEIPPEVEPRAILESQLLSIKSRLLSIVTTGEGERELERIVVTGGSALNPVFQQVSEEAGAFFAFGY
jgi:xylulokinase